MSDPFERALKLIFPLKLFLILDGKYLLFLTSLFSLFIIQLQTPSPILDAMYIYTKNFIGLIFFRHITLQKMFLRYTSRNESPFY